MPTARTLLIIAATVLAATSTALAHDFWIRPSTFRPRADTLIEVDLRVGDDYPGDPFARKGTIIERFVAIDPASGKEADIVGLEGRSPAGAVRVGQDGTRILVYRSKHSTVDLEPAKFEDYLREEGLEKIVEIRKRSGTSGARGKEMYSRCAKSIVFIGDGSSVSGAGFDHAVGLPLELIPRTDPRQAKSGEPFRLDLVLHGKPCVGVLVHATCVDDPKATAEGRTSEDGRVNLALPRGGVWVFNAVEMFAAEKRAEKNPKGCEWESLWASLSVEISSGTPTRESRVPAAAP